MIDETKLQPWVDSEVDEDGDLRLYSAIDEKAKVATYTVMSIKERKIKQWLKAQGWASPEEKAELLHGLVRMESLCVLRHDDPERQTARDVIAKAKGEQS